MARDAARLKAVADDLTAFGAAKVDVHAADLSKEGSAPAIVAAAVAALGTLDYVLIAHGVLPDQARAEKDAVYAAELTRVNLASPVALSMEAARVLEQQGSGCLAAIGSVAGDRIRLSNYVYGAAKGALALHLDGLRTRLAKRGVRVVTIKPGFVDTPMTASFRKGLLWASPQSVGRGIYRAMTGSTSGTVYLPAFWRLIMFMLRMIPGPIFRRLPI